MGASDVQVIIEQVDQLLAEEELSERVEAAIQKLLNVVEALSADKKSLADEVERLRKQLEQKKRAKTTSNSDKDGKDDNQDASSDHSSEKRRRKLRKKKLEKYQGTIASTRLPFLLAIISLRTSHRDVTFIQLNAVYNLLANLGMTSSPLIVMVTVVNG